MNSALKLVNDMIRGIEISNSQAHQACRGMDNAIGFEGYYWQKLLTLRSLLQEEAPRIGHEGDALEVVESVITSMDTLHDALQRGII